MGLAVILIFVLPIIVLKAHFEPRPRRLPKPLSMPRWQSRIKQDSASLPKPQRPPP